MSLPAPTLWQVEVPGGGTISAAWDPAPAAGPRQVFICAHGAGGHMADRSVLAVSAALRQRQLHVVRFNFPYRESGSGRPDPMPRLLASLRAVVAWVRTELSPDLLVLGGRSMGGRAASVLVADGHPCDGLLLLAYPLHPPGQPEKLRTAHLPGIQVPVLSFSGTRDAFCQRDLMDTVVARLGPRWTMQWLEGADHSFHVLKRSGTTDAAVLAHVADLTRAWVDWLAKARG